MSVTKRSAIINDLLKKYRDSMFVDFVALLKVYFEVLILEMIAK